MAKVSIIIATYNRQKHLQLLLDCLALQTYQDFEIIIMDEGNPEANEIIASNKIKIIKCEDYNDWGQTAKEKALEYAVGEYVMFPNDDAYYVPIALEVMVGGMENNDMVYCDWLFDNHGYSKIDVMPIIGMIDVGGFMTKTRIVRELGWFNKGSCGDGYLIQAIANKYKHKKVNGVLYVKN